MIEPAPSSASSPGTLSHSVLAFSATTSEETSQCTVCHTDAPWTLRYGGTLPKVRLAYELSGPEHAPLVAVQGGISAGRHVTATATHPSPGWWQSLVGPGCPIDTQRFRVLAFDYLGGNGESSGPRDLSTHTENRGDEPGADNTPPFPNVSTVDQARALAALLEHLDEGSLHAFIGASYGGMVGLALAAEFPQSVERLLVISAAHRSHPQATAWRSLQRNIVELGLAQGCVHQGLALARGLAMTTYRTPVELAQRFDQPPTMDDDGSVCFPVESYLEARGEAFAQSFHPDAFLNLSRSIDLHRVDTATIAVPTHLVAVTSDLLVPVEDMRQLANTLTDVTLHEIDSLFGHDAFLKETTQIGAIMRRSLNTGDLSS